MHAEGDWPDTKIVEAVVFAHQGQDLFHVLQQIFRPPAVFGVFDKDQVRARGPMPPQALFVGVLLLAPFANPPPTLPTLLRRRPLHLQLLLVLPCVHLSRVGRRSEESGIVLSGKRDVVRRKRCCQEMLSGKIDVVRKNRCCQEKCILSGNDVRKNVCCQEMLSGKMYVVRKNRCCQEKCMLSRK